MKKRLYMIVPVDIDADCQKAFEYIKKQVEPFFDVCGGGDVGCYDAQTRRGRWATPENLRELADKLEKKAVPHE